MKYYKALLLGVVLLAATRFTASAQLFTDSFESYTRGILDANPGGPNSAPNGGPGNPWWTPAPTALRVVGPEASISPHSGTNMVRGAATPTPHFDQEFYNLAYRAAHSNLVWGNLKLDWWFYDVAGTNVSAVNYQDYGSLAYYTGIPTNTDYVLAFDPDPGFLDGSLSIGGSYSQGAGFRVTNYQAQILHTTSTNAYDLGDGWFNLPKLRTIGWHHARIAIAAAAPGTSTDVSFYIDDMSTALLTTNSPTTNGFNAVTLQSNYGSQTGYFDDLSADVPAPPVLSIVVAGNNAIVSWPSTGWTLQSSTNLSGTNFVDVLGVSSPYTNALNGAAQFFRLRQ